MKGLVLAVGVAVACSGAWWVEGCSSSSPGSGSDGGVEGGSGSGGSGGGSGSSGGSSGSSGGSSGSSSGSSGGSSGSSSGSSGGSSGSSSGGSPDGGCASPTAAVANPCTQLVGACLVTNPSPGQINCDEYYGPLFAATGGSNQCNSSNTWIAGMTCAQALPGGVNAGCASMVGDNSCEISYYPCLATCTTCNASKTTCVTP